MSSEIFLIKNLIELRETGREGPNFFYGNFLKKGKFKRISGWGGRCSPLGPQEFNAKIQPV
jgi:hypothetical protein